jgi:NAD(P) transhydrogenase subunit beta
LNGLGGIASLFVAIATYLQTKTGIAVLQSQGVDWHVAILASVFIGAVTFTGSVIAILKLMGKLGDSSFGLFKWLVKIGVVAYIAGGVYFVQSGQPEWTMYALVGCALILGVALVVPVGGADMPVVIALLNSYSGLAGAATGFVLGNNGLIITGSLVGSSGLILTSIMCKAMNRSLLNVLFGGALSEQGETMSKGDHDEFYAGKVKQTSAEEVAMMLEAAQKVVIVPGYGLAVAQAQHVIRELATHLEDSGIEVKYAIHPVAGRMPGHMNVLLAEAEVPYDQLIEMSEINPEFAQTDVAIVVGANDVTNPAASNDKASPIYGMPILDVSNAKTVVVVKRSLSPGFAGIPNELFIQDNSLMFYDDAKKAVQDVVNAYKDM